MSTIYNIKHQKDYYIGGVSRRNVYKLTMREKQRFADIINEYLVTHSDSWTVDDIQNYAKIKHDVKYPKHIVRNIMINDANLSYKKVSSRPRNHCTDTIREARTLFVIRFAQLLHSDTLILNVDEANVGRDCKIMYSWSHKGQVQELQNTTLWGSIKLILWICSNGWWFGMITRDNINSN